MSKTVERAAKLDVLARKVMRQLSLGGKDPLGDLPLAQLRLLRSLTTSPRPAGEVGEELKISPSALSQLAQRLACTGLIVKDEDPADRRVKRLALSAEGCRKMEVRDKLRMRRATAMLERLSAEDQERLLSILVRLVESASTDSIDTLSTVAGEDKGLPI